MRNLHQLTIRRRELLDLVDEAEAVADCSCPNHSHQERKAARRAAAALTYAVHQIEWALGLREHTFVDDLRQDDSTFSLN
jgi:hypothetical protein